MSRVHRLFTGNASKVFCLSLWFVVVSLLQNLFSLVEMGIELSVVMWILFSFFSLEPYGCVKKSCVL